MAIHYHLIIFQLIWNLLLLLKGCCSSLCFLLSVFAVFRSPVYWHFISGELQQGPEKVAVTDALPCEQEFLCGTNKTQVRKKSLRSY